MAAKYPYIDVSRAPELLKLVEQVRETKQAQTLRLADDVVAVVMPERKTASRKVGSLASSPALPTTYTLESARGSVPTPPHLKGKGIDDVIREAKEDYAERIAHE